MADLTDNLVLQASISGKLSRLFKRSSNATN